MMSQNYNQPYGQQPPYHYPPPGYNYHRGGMGKIVLGGAVVLLLIGLILVMTGLSKARRANALEETLKQDEQTYVSKLDEVVRVISSKYEVAQQYPDQIRSVVEALAKGREGGSIFRSVNEQNANVFSSNLLEEVQRTVEGKRAEFTNEFRRYADHAREYNTLIRDPLWGSRGLIGQFFMGQREPVDPMPIISDRVGEAQRTRRDNRSDLDGDLTAPSRVQGLGQPQE